MVILLCLAQTLEGANLNNTKLPNINLRQANLENTQLQNVDCTQCRVAGAIFTDACGLTTELGQWLKDNNAEH